MAAEQTDMVAGIDVGGTKKGFHLVVLQGSAVMCRCVKPGRSRTSRALFAIQSICRWHRCAFAMGSRRHRSGGGEMARERISCFATPTLARANASTSGFYEWMFNGARVYEVFADIHPVLRTDRYSASLRPLKLSPTPSRARFSDVTLPQQSRSERSGVDCSRNSASTPPS